MLRLLNLSYFYTKRRWRLFLYILFSLSLLHCSKSGSPAPDNSYGLPNVGEWGMGCLINGKPWISTHTNLTTQIYADSVLDISGMPASDYYDNLLIGIKLNSGNPLGKAIAVDTSTNFILYLTDSTCNGFQPHGVRSFALQGTVTVITLDRVNRQVTATFEGILPIPNCDTFHITEGRFNTSF